MATVVHFEIPADDVARAKKFYGELFGWRIEQFTGATPMEYWTVNTGRQEGQMGVDGGLMKRQDPEQKITVYIDVPSVDESVAKVKGLEARWLFPRWPSPAWAITPSASTRKTTASVSGKITPRLSSTRASSLA